MSLDEIDVKLAGWKTKAQLVSDNIMALRESAAYQRLRGEGGWPKVVLSGETETRVGSALGGHPGAIDALRPAHLGHRPGD